jgi:hypothetical protein
MVINAVAGPRENGTHEMVVAVQRKSANSVSSRADPITRDRQALFAGDHAFGRRGRGLK